MRQRPHRDEPFSPANIWHLDRLVVRTAIAFPSQDIHPNLDVHRHEWMHLGYHRIVLLLKKLLGLKATGPSPTRPRRERRHKPPAACTYALSAQAMRWMR